MHVAVRILGRPSSFVETAVPKGGVAIKKADGIVPVPRDEPPDNSEHRKVITFEPSALPTLLVDSFEMVGEIRSLLLLKPGESLGIELEPVGQKTMVDPGKYNIVCNTKSGEQWRLVSDVEVRPGHLTIVRPQTLFGKVQIDELTRPGFPKIKIAQLVPAGEIDGGVIHGSPRQPPRRGVPILEGNVSLSLQLNREGPSYLSKTWRLFTAARPL